MKAMQKVVKHWIDALLNYAGFDPSQVDGIDQWVAFLFVVLIAFAVDALLGFILLRGVKRIVARTKAGWDDMLFSDRVLRRMSHVFTPILIYILLPVAFPRESEALRILVRVLQIGIVVVIFRFISAVIYSAFEIMAQRPAWQGKPIKGLRQTGQGIVMLICAVLIVSILIGKSPC